MWMAWTSPPNSSQTTSWASSSCLTLWGAAWGLSHLLTATMIGTETEEEEEAQCASEPWAPSARLSVRLCPGRRLPGPEAQAASVPSARSARPGPTSGGLGVLDGLHGLVHDPVVSRHHQNHHVGGVGPPGPHGGEGSVSRCVQEGDLLT